MITLTVLANLVTPIAFVNCTYLFVWECVAASPGFFEHGVLPWAQQQKAAGDTYVGKALDKYLDGKKDWEEKKAVPKPRLSS